MSCHISGFLNGNKGALISHIHVQKYKGYLEFLAGILMDSTNRVRNANYRGVFVFRRNNLIQISANSLVMETKGILPRLDLTFGKLGLSMKSSSTKLNHTLLI